MLTIMMKKAHVSKREYVSGSHWVVYYDAIVNRDDEEEEIDCGFLPFATEETALDAAADWIYSDPKNDALAIKLTDAYMNMDPYGPDYGDVLRSTIEALQTPDGMKQLIEELADMLIEANA